MEYRAVKIILAAFLTIAFAAPLLPSQSSTMTSRAYAGFVKRVPGQPDREATGTGVYELSSDSLRFVRHQPLH